MLNLTRTFGATVCVIALAGCGTATPTASSGAAQTAAPSLTPSSTPQPSAPAESSSNAATTSLVCQFVTGGSPPTVGITLTVAADTNPNACGILADGLVNNSNIAGWTVATGAWPFQGAAVCGGAYPGGTGTLQDAAATAKADAQAICANLGWQ